MSDPEAPKRYCFETFTGGELSTEHQRWLVREAAKYGLVPCFAVTLNPIEEEIEDHFRETYPPRSREDYLGKEHFQRAGAEVALGKQTMGRMFNHVIYPLQTSTYGRVNAVIHPSNLGLVVAERRAVGMPQAPQSWKLGEAGTNQRLHAGHPSGNKIPAPQVVVQVGGLIDLSQAPERLNMIKDMAEGYPLHEQFQHFGHWLHRLVTPPPEAAEA